MTEPIRRRAPVPRQQCALAKAAEEIGDRWVLLILREAFYGVMRYDDIREDLGIPRSILTERLKRLVEQGLLEKRPYREPGDRQRFGYVLTEKGRGLTTGLIALTHWSETHILGHSGPVAIVDKATGGEVEVVLVDDHGAVVPPQNVEIKVR